MSPCWLFVWCMSGWSGGGGVWFLRIGSVSGAGGFPHSNCVCGVCARVVWVGCSVVGALVGGRCVGELGCVRVYVFAEWSGCSMVLCLVLVFRCVNVILNLIRGVNFQDQGTLLQITPINTSCYSSGSSLSFIPCGSGIRIEPTFTLVRVIRVD